MARGKEGRGEGKVAEDGTGDGTSEASGGGEGGREESTDPPPVDYGDAPHLVVRMSMLRKGDYVAKGSCCRPFRSGATVVFAVHGN